MNLSEGGRHSSKRERNDKEIRGRRVPFGTPNLPTNIMDFRGFDSSIILIVKGWNSQAHGGFPRKFESGNLSMDNLSRETGRTAAAGCCVARTSRSRRIAWPVYASACRCAGRSHYMLYGLTFKLWFIMHNVYNNP